MEIEQKPYENLTAMRTARDVSSHTYDDVLYAVYIWSDLMDRSDTQQNTLREDERSANHGLGTPSDDAITCLELFAVIDKAVETVDASKLPAWQASFPSLRNSMETFARCEGMVVILRRAIALGGEYPEFNDVQHTVQDAIGEAIWQQIDEIAMCSKKRAMFAALRLRS